MAHVDPTRRLPVPQPPDRRHQSYADVLLNRYRVIETHDNGGFGCVLVCWDTRLQRRVALKRLPLAGGGAHAATTSTLSEALREARTASMLSNQHIVMVHDFEYDGSYAYIVMEHIDGLNLGELLHAVEYGTLNYEETACVVTSIAEALSFAHRNGVLHLDIKPTNIMIDRTGTVKLCDFGMAMLASAAGYGGARGGTVGYMPPEQIVGDVVDERTDVFALAVVAWQALLGSTPFAPPPEKAARMRPEQRAEASLALIHKGAPKPSKRDPNLAGIAEEALLGAFAEDPANRIPSVEAFAGELAFALGDPDAGAKSLANLVNQALGDDQVDEDEGWEGERLPLAVAYPQLPGIVARLLAAATTLRLAWLLTPQLTSGMQAAHAAAFACAAAAALWPPLGSALVVATAYVAIGRTATTAAPLLLAAVLAVAFVIWWATCAVRSRYAGSALLLAGCTSSPLAGVAIAGATLAPAEAAATAVAAWVAGSLWPALLAAHFALDGQVDALLEPLAEPAALVSLAGCGLSALVCAGIARRRPETGVAVAAQVVGCLMLVGTQLLAARMENGGIWVDPSWANTGIAVLLCVLVCLSCILHGPRDASTESEE